MSDLLLSIKLTTEDGNIVVKELNAVNKAADGVTDSLKKTSKAGSKAGEGFKKAGTGAKKFKESSSAASAESEKLASNMFKLAGAGALVYGALRLVGVAQDIAVIADEFNILEQRVKTATKGTGEFDMVWESLYRNAQKNGAEVATTVALFQRLSIGRKELHATNEMMLEFTDTVQMIGVIGGSSTEAMKFGLTQLSQAMSSPLVRAEEFNSILENIPHLAMEIGKGMGDLGVGELRQMVIDGKLLSKDVFEAILKQLPDIATEFEELPLTLARTSVEMDNAWSAIMSRLDKAAGVTQSWAGFLHDVAGGLDSMDASELESYINALTTAGSVTAALLAAMLAAPVAAAVWSGGMKIAQVASGLFAAQNALTTASMFTLRTAAFSVAAAFAGWQIGTYLREEFEIVEKAGIAMTAGIHRILLQLNGHFDVLAEGVRYALTHPLDFARERLADYLQWIASLGSKVLGMLGLDGVFDGLHEKLEIYRTASGEDHQATLQKIKADTKSELSQLDAIYSDMFANVGKGAKATSDALDGIETPGADSSGASTAGVEKLNKALLALYNTQKLNASAINEQGQALDGIDLELFKAKFVEATELPKNAADAIKEFSATAAAAAQAFTNAEFLTTLQQENALLQVRLEKGKEEYEIQKALFALKGGDPAILAAIEQELQAQQRLNEQIKISEEIAKDSFGGMGDGLSELISKVDDIGASLAQAFGDAAKQISQMSKEQGTYNKEMDTLASKRKILEALDKKSEARAKGLLKIQKQESKLNRDHFQNQMGQFSALAGATSQMFGEQSKERENLHKLEMAFGAIEMAMALQKAAVNAINAITNQGSGDPYTAFARMAAMAAIMAGLGVFDGSVSGGGVSSAERQETQGTGTVLGDSSAKSNSLENTFERIEGLELDQYNELRSINDSIQALSRGIASLAVSLVQSYGRFDEQGYDGDLGAVSNTDTGGHFEDVGTKANFGLGDPLGGVVDSIIGGISKTTKDLIDSGISFDAQSLGELIANGTMDATYYSVIETTERKMWGLTKDISQNTEYSAIDGALNAQFAQVFTHIGSSITGAVNVLGIQTANDLSNFVIDLPHISFKDLTGDEIEAELNAVLSSQSDAMAQFILPGIAEFQKMGEGLYETLLRVSQEQAIFNAQMDALGLSLKDVSGVSAEAQVEIAQSIIGLMGGIEAYREATGNYFNEFYTDAEKFNFLSGTLNNAFTDLGLSVPTSRDEFRTLVEGIDQTTASGQQLFATLMELVPGMKEYVDQLDAQRAFVSDNQTELTQLDMNPFEQSMADLDAWYQEQITTAEELGADTVFLERLYARKRADVIEDALADLNASHEKAVKTLSAEYDKLFNTMDKVGSNIANAILSIQRQAAGWDEVGHQDSIVSNLYEQVGAGSTSDQVGVVGDLQSAIMARYKAELAANKEVQQAAKQRYQIEKAAVNAMRAAAKSLLQAADALLLSADSPALLGTQLSDAKSQFSTLLASAQGGNAGAAQQLQGVGSSYLGIAKDFYAQGSTEYADIFAEIQTAYRGVGADGLAAAEAKVPSVIRSYQSTDAQLQREAIAELSQLQVVLDELRVKEKAELELANATLDAQRQVEAAELLEVQRDQVTAINNSAVQVVNELQVQGQNAAAQNVALLDEVRRLRTAQTRTQEMIIGLRRIG